MAAGTIGFIGLGKETTFGTPVAATDYILALSENITLTKDRFELTNINNRFTEPDDMAGLDRYAGQVVFPSDPTALGFFLRSVFGTMSGSVVLSGFLWKNEFTTALADFSANSPVPPYTFEVFRDVTSSNQYAGGVVNQLTLASQVNQELRVSAGMIFKTSSVIAKSAASYVSSPTYPFAFDTASISIAGAGSAIVEAMTVTIDNQLEGIPVINASTEIVKIRRKGFQSVRLSGTVGFENLTEYNIFKAQTEQRIFAHFFRASSFSLLIDMPRVVYSSFPLGIPGRDRLTVGFEGIARYHAGSAQAIKVDLTNTKSNY